ncbi:hypothetical protein HRK28_17670 [Rathayibacter sp. VKM Ac-2835]|uniref:hypothetical protein n=1 Tax=Rathayibacter sp. VKM Ac-2835 TaxID=2739043 RepID=UPI001566FA97|nr:hypothetical protein [Rathayibacter sp. VKM Ac-2835]NRG42746.1 hypothetical protein [Rathayibacter sp. VKM Ac-2835]
MIPLVEGSRLLERSAQRPTRAVFAAELGVALIGWTMSTVVGSPVPSFVAAGLVLVLGTVFALTVSAARS